MAVEDIRIKLSLPAGPKYKRLVKTMGVGAMHHLVCLWCTVATARPTGVLSGWDETDIAIAGDWDGDAILFVQYLANAKWLEKDGECWQVHDWEEHQGWVVGARERSEIARRAGLASARARQRGRAQSVNAVSTGSSTGSSTPRSTPSPSPSPSPSPLPSNTLSGFPEFWQQYPKKKAKGDALKAWARAVKLATPAAIMEGLAKAKKSEDWRKEDGRFIPYPATWLNRRCWEDEYPEPFDALKHTGRG